MNLRILPGLAFLTILLTALVVCPVSQRSIHAQSTSYGGERGRNAGSWDGIWSTNYGQMDLAQDDNIVVGRYEENNGILSGTVNGRILTFTWEVDPDVDFDSEGIGEFTLSEDGESFDGIWQYKNGGQEFDWDGVKLGPREISASRAGVEYCFWAGSWTTDLGVIAFDQDINESTVTGEFITIGTYGTFTAAAEGWHLYCDWETEYMSGTCRFEMDDDLGSFSGTMEYDTDADDEVWDGTFLSSSIREDFTGLWVSDWGDMNVVQDRLTGVFVCTIADGEIDEWAGEIMVSGNVVGNVCTFYWIIETRRESIDGRAVITMSETGDSFTGAWAELGGAGESGKLTGRLL